ncbi:MAG: 8-oxo-dGTP diphosphatase [Oligoflexia bacterium]|nr:8-oxo-dGTP diphosphatase [Oligoflexia bacterium]
MKQTTLCFVIDQSTDSLLMIHKKKGQGEGKWNVPGGKIQENETPLEGATRECIEETGIRPLELQQKGSIEFVFPNGGSWSNHSTIFLTTKFEGTLVHQQTDECTAAWIKLSSIPYENMWEDDKLWIPQILKGEVIKKRYIFDADNSMLREEIL